MTGMYLHTQEADAALARHAAQYAGQNIALYTTHNPNDSYYYLQLCCWDLTTLSHKPSSLFGGARLQDLKDLEVGKSWRASAYGDKFVLVRY